MIVRKTKKLPIAESAVIAGIAGIGNLRFHEEALKLTVRAIYFALD